MTAVENPTGSVPNQQRTPDTTSGRAAALSASVILCAYTEDRWDDLTAAVQSISEQSISPQEVILIIDHNPALYERARRAFPGIFIKENQKARGLSGARNTGIELASGDFFVFMDEDAIASPNWLEQLLAPYDDPRVNGVGGAIDPLWLAGKPRWFPAEFNWVVGCTYKGMPVRREPVRNLIGANMSYRREVFETAGMFTSGMGRIGTLPLGCEETELCIRASQKMPDKIFLFEPNARVQHRVPAKRATWRYFLSRCYSEGLSKAQVAQLVGAQRGLSNERTYTFRALPAGMLAGLRDAVRGDFSGLGRAAAIVLGLFTTTYGYLRGKLKMRTSASPAMQRPVRG